MKIVKPSHVQVTVKWTAATLQYAYDINFDRFISSVTRRWSFLPLTKCTEIVHAEKHKNKNINFGDQQKTDAYLVRSIDVCGTKHHLVHDRLLHPHFRHCSSPASARWQVTPYHSTCRTAASTAQTLLVASICGPPAAISCSYRDTGVPCSVVGSFL